jgi:nitroreductase
LDKENNEMISNQKFNKPIVDIIKSRRSVRTYKPEELSKELKDKIKNYAKEIKGPFDSKVRLELIDATDIAQKSDGKIGTYGVIKGAKAYIAAITEKDGKNSLEQLGYALEELIIFAASLNLGTCWLGGTFKKSEFAKLVDVKENEIMPIVTPVGYIADNKSMMESFMRLAAGSNNRKQWKDLFFNESFECPLEEKDAGDYKTALEMLRLAPSASNKQPWRVLKRGNSYHFYLSHTKGYGNALGFSIQKIDMGIAMCHFELTLHELGLKGMWKVNQDMLKNNKDDVEYIVSWIRN